MRDLLKDNADARRLLLERLYTERMRASQQDVGGFVPRRVLADLAAHVDFLLATLSEQGLVHRDGDRYRITGAGCAALETETEE